MSGTALAAGGSVLDDGWQDRRLAPCRSQNMQQTVEAERGIELLQERRTALISAAVTGQIDVRGLVTS